MSEIILLTSPDQKSTAKIEDGELVSYVFQGEELIHQKGSPGWSRADIEMFPVVGPTKQQDFKIKTPKGTSIQDQHGILRELRYEVENKTENTITLKKVYVAETKIKNSKFPNRSPEEHLSWNYDFTFKKKYELTNNELKIIFSFESEPGMPFMVGYHPAFKLTENLEETFVTKDNKTYTIQEVMNTNTTAHPLIECDEVTLTKTTGHNVNIKTTGFNNIMLWSEVPNMVCIEPTTYFPFSEENKSKTIEESMRTSKGKEEFTCIITPKK